MGSTQRPARRQHRPSPRVTRRRHATTADDRRGRPYAPHVKRAPVVDCEAELERLAADAVTSIDNRLGAGEDVGVVVADVLHGVFDGGRTGTMDRITAAVRAIIDED